MSDDSLQLNDVISLSIRLKEERIRFVARVTGAGEESFTIDLSELPVSGVPLVGPGDEVHGTVTRRDAVYHFKTSILERGENDFPGVLSFRKPEKFWREQRRQFFRVDRSLPISVKLDYTSDDGSRQIVQLKGTVVNISAGGVQILVNLPQATIIEEGSQVLVTFTLQADHFRELPGRIVRVKESADRQLFAMIFVDPEREIQNKITRANIIYERGKLKGD